MINVGEYGLVIYFDLNEDISSNTNQVILKDRKGTETTKTASVGATTISTDLGTMTANQYITYTLAEGDITESGRWSVRAVSEGGGKKRFTDWRPLEVKP